MKKEFETDTEKVDDQESEEEAPPQIPTIDEDTGPKPYTYKVFRSNNGKCIAEGLRRRGNWQEVSPFNIS